ncbi:uncharacterized protein CLUP02_14113 [Colletotrichum lupini]|uniref:Secreted protein n=1 Tax=Colletotrichum lupini TaxID=145971 RepID=A0A9Q8T3P3_9PEZI|nr:uncharacterized protein CLUP02_14113 [Colletotrichum lupini]UQC88588.1 hypothetical protein CLUP02_14113 [Colletotrichum lupini]
MPIIRITALGVWGVCHEIWMWLMLPTLSGPAFCDRRPDPWPIHASLCCPAYLTMAEVRTTAIGTMAIEAGAIKSKRKLKAMWLTRLATGRMCPCETTALAWSWCRR